MSLHDDTYAFAHRIQDLTIHLVQTAEGELPGHGGSTSTAKTLIRVAEEWRQADSTWTAPGTRITANGRDRSPTQTGMSSDLARPFVRPIRR